MTWITFPSATEQHTWPGLIKKIFVLHNHIEIKISSTLVLCDISPEILTGAQTNNGGYCKECTKHNGRACRHELLLVHILLRDQKFPDISTRLLLTTPHWYAAFLNWIGIGVSSTNWFVPRVLDVTETKLTTSVFVILASSSVRLSPHCDWLAESSCRPQIAAPTLPVAIMEGGYMANLKSVWGEKNTKLNVNETAWINCAFKHWILCPPGTIWNDNLKWLFWLYLLHKLVTARHNMIW